LYYLTVLVFYAHSRKRTRKGRWRGGGGIIIYTGEIQRKIIIYNNKTHGYNRDNASPPLHSPPLSTPSVTNRPTPIFFKIS